MHINKEVRSKWLGAQKLKLRTREVEGRGSPGLGYIAK
jgi:hypothetical protein